MNKLQAGFSRLNVTPPLGIPIVGYYKPRFAEGVLDELEVNALALAVEDKRVVLLSVDNCGFSETVANSYRDHICDVTGRIEIDGDKVFLNRNAYTTADPANAKFEAHRAYADVMYMVEGEETIYVKPVSQLSNITAEYNPEGDYLLADFDADATPVHLTAGSFIILLPQDAHAPNCWYGEAKNVKKIVGKVLL